MDSRIYALNLFNVSNKEEYLAYARRSPAEVARHGGRVIALGKFLESVTGEIEPRKVMILVEWNSRAAFESYCADESIQDLHFHRERGTLKYIWHLFDKLEDLRPILKE